MFYMYPFSYDIVNLTSLKGGFQNLCLYVKPSALGGCTT